MLDDLQTGPILQRRLTDPPWALPGGARMPGTSPIDPDDWMRLDDAFAGQMAQRDKLIAHRPEKVHALRPDAVLAASELLEMALSVLRGRTGYDLGETMVRRPDGVQVPLDRTQPLLTLGRLAQQDFCVLQSNGTEHMLSGAILCFPASWSLDQKIDRPLTGIHDPVPIYDDDIARRVQRLFDAIRPGHPIRRSNFLLYSDPSLYQPRREGDHWRGPRSKAPYLRTERQCLLRLPETGAVVFSIHTTVMLRADLTPTESAQMQAYLMRSAQG